MINRELLAEQYGEDLLFLEPPGQFDSCIAGVVSRCGSDPVIAYDEAKVINALIDSGMSQEDALDWYDFNIVGSYVGEKTPMFLVVPEVE